MLKDLTNEICDNGYCEIKSDYFTSKVEHDYDFDDFYKEECDESNNNLNERNYEPFKISDCHNKEIKFYECYSYTDIRRNRFNVVINGIQNLSSDYLSKCIEKVSFDNNAVYIKFFAEPKLYRYMYEELKNCYDVGFSPNFGDITIQLLDPTGVVALEHKFLRTYISKINQEGFCYDVDYLPYLDVTFNYDNYLVENINNETASKKR